MPDETFRCDATMQCAYCGHAFDYRYRSVLAICDECMATQHDAAMRSLVCHSFARRLYHRIRSLFTRRLPSGGLRR